MVPALASIWIAIVVVLSVLISTDAHSDIGSYVPLKNGTAALGTAAILPEECAIVVTVSESGVLTTDVVSWGFNGDITAVTGYAPITTGGLSIYVYPTANNVNFKVCNPTSSSITPGAVTLNYQVVR